MDDDGDVIRIGRSCAVPVSELEWRFTTSGGPGGQHANRSATAVEVLFDAANSPSLGPTQRARIVERLGPVVRARSSDERSQLRNRQVAVDRLRARLATALAVRPVRRPTRPSRASNERRLQAKRQRSDVKKQRRERPEG